MGLSNKSRRLTVMQNRFVAAKIGGGGQRREGLGVLGLSEANDYIQDRKTQETLNKEMYSVT